MNTKYNFDRDFTDFIHENVALNKIYKKISWSEATIEKNYLEAVDRNKGIDYFFIKDDHQLVSVQERFRDKKYSKYNDFTIRYRRDFSQHEEQKLSEFFKIKADYFTYGICNGSKYDIKSTTDFLKFVVLDLKIFRKNVDNRKIKVVDSNSYSSSIVNNQLHAPIKKNKDFSSNFVVFDIQHLEKIDKEIILIQKGFIKN